MFRTITVMLLCTKHKNKMLTGVRQQKNNNDEQQSIMSGIKVKQS